MERENADAQENTKIELEILKKNTNLFVPEQRKKLLKALQKQMEEYADKLEYELAASIRDQINEIKQQFK